MRPGIEPQAYRTNSVRMATDLTASQCATGTFDVNCDLSMTKR